MLLLPFTFFFIFETTIWASDYYVDVLFHTVKVNQDSLSSNYGEKKKLESIEDSDKHSYFKNICHFLLYDFKKGKKYTKMQIEEALKALAFESFFYTRVGVPTYTIDYEGDRAKVMIENKAIRPLWIYPFSAYYLKGRSRFHAGYSLSQVLSASFLQYRRRTSIQLTTGYAFPRSMYVYDSLKSSLENYQNISHSSLDPGVKLIRFSRLSSNVQFSFQRSYFQFSLNSGYSKLFFFGYTPSSRDLNFTYKMMQQESYEYGYLQLRGRFFRMDSLIFPKKGMLIDTAWQVTNRDWSIWMGSAKALFPFSKYMFGVLSVSRYAAFGSDQLPYFQYYRRYAYKGHAPFHFSTKGSFSFRFPGTIKSPFAILHVWPYVSYERYGLTEDGKINLDSSAVAVGTTFYIEPYALYFNLESEVYDSNDLKGRPRPKVKFAFKREFF